MRSNGTRADKDLKKRYRAFARSIPDAGVSTFVCSFFCMWRPCRVEEVIRRFARGVYAEGGARGGSAAEVFPALGSRLLSAQFLFAVTLPGGRGNSAVRARRLRRSPTEGTPSGVSVDSRCAVSGISLLNFCMWRPCRAEEVIRRFVRRRRRRTRRLCRRSIPGAGGDSLSGASEAAAFERAARKARETSDETAALASPGGPGEGAFAAAGMDSPSLHFL